MANKQRNPNRNKPPRHEIVVSANATTEDRQKMVRDYFASQDIFLSNIPTFTPGSKLLACGCNFDGHEVHIDFTEKSH